MTDLSNRKLNNKKLLLSFLTMLLTAVFSINLALVTDPGLFAIFFTVAATASAFLNASHLYFASFTASVAGLALSYVLTKDFYSSLLAISYLPFSVTLPLIHKKKLKRYEAISIASAVITAVFSSVILYITYASTGYISLSAIREAFPFFFKQISELLYSSFEVSVAGTVVPLIAESNVVSYLNTIVCLIPAVLYVTLILLGFLIAGIYKKITENTLAAMIEKESWDLLPSVVSSVVFLLSLLIIAIFERYNLVFLSALNMLIIIFPLVFLTGLLTSFTPKEVNGVKCLRIFRPITLIIAVFNGVVPFIMISAFYGLYDSFAAVISKRKAKKQE